MGHDLGLFLYIVVTAGFQFMLDLHVCSLAVFQKA
jgi:hypothetical protein